MAIAPMLLEFDTPQRRRPACHDVCVPRQTRLATARARAASDGLWEPSSPRPECRSQRRSGVRLSVLQISVPEHSGWTFRKRVVAAAPCEPGMDSDPVKLRHFADVCRLCEHEARAAWMLKRCLASADKSMMTACLRPRPPRQHSASPAQLLYLDAGPRIQ